MIEFQSGINPSEELVVDQSEILAVLNFAINVDDPRFVFVAYEGLVNNVEGMVPEDSVGFVAFTPTGFRQYVEILNKVVASLDK